MMIAKLLTFYHHLIVGFFRGARKSVLGNFIHSGYFAANLLFGFVALLMKCNVVGYALSQLIVSMLFTALFLIVGNRVIELKEYQGHAIVSDIKIIISKGLGYMMNMVWQSIYFQGGTFVVRLTLGPESVAIFNTMRTACRSVSQLFNIINGSIYPELQYEYGIGNMHVVHRLFRTSILVSFLIGIGGALLLSIFGLDIYNWWTHNALMVSDEIWYIFIIGVVFNGVWWTCIVAYSVTNNPYDFSIPSTIVAIISVGISYVLSVYLGLLGSVLGIVLFDVIMMFYILPNSSKLLGLTTKDIFSKTSEDVMCLAKTVLKKYNY